MVKEDDMGLEVLKAARELISDSQHFSMGALARDENGQRVWSQSDEACRWSLVGALIKVSGSLTAAYKASWALRGVVGDRLSEWESHPQRAHGEVLSALDAAIGEGEP